MVVGDMAVGKTSTINAILGEAFNHKHNSTEVAEVQTAVSLTTEQALQWKKGQGFEKKVEQAITMMASSSTGQELAEDKDEEDAEKSKQDEKTKPHVDQESKKPQAEAEKSKQDETTKSQVDQASIKPQATSCNTSPINFESEKASEKVEEAGVLLLEPPHNL